MKKLNLILVYAYSLILAHLFYFHNAIYEWNKELFVIQINEYNIVKMYLLAIGIMILLIIGYKLIDDLFL